MDVYRCECGRLTRDEDWCGSCTEAERTAPSVMYDPPSGWRYGFPKVYQPLPNETLAETLVRDGYPARDAEFGAKHCRFIRYGSPQ